ncbi:hypothetical protein EIN_113570 [Entamoeba invadens IP1]|uniref:Tubby C-terminal domain-containing protein n=1 Tax=Entamoeba invadens IP1 TaxID=370355 RepID=A0A0A1TXY2_ENTIV|nr:hypothetical protein EIN_113570 [Entamoeba invadens IP1]ELP86253.1 hypothetical protein EIN_113570 [Entamoeba invadens IP1]|eukprot:XP_004185599.1 hypothetical protein EIN_113570 [Entamoeba invadens IP1]
MSFCRQKYEQKQVDRRYKNFEPIFISKGMNRIYPLNTTPFGVSLHEKHILECFTGTEEVYSTFTFKLFQKGIFYRQFTMSEENTTIYSTSCMTQHSNCFTLFDNKKNPVASILKVDNLYKVFSERNVLTEVTVKGGVVLSTKLFVSNNKSGLCYVNKAPLCIDNKEYLDFSVPTLPSFKNIQLVSPRKYSEVVFEMAKQKSFYHVSADAVFTPLQAFAIAVIKGYETYLSQSVCL